MKKQNIYVGNSKDGYNKISLKELLMKHLSNDFEGSQPTGLESERFSDDSASWIQIDQLNDETKQMISVVIGFDPKNDNKLRDIKVWAAPVVTKVDMDKSKELI